MILRFKISSSTHDACAGVKQAKERDMSLPPGTRLVFIHRQLYL